MTGETARLSRLVGDYQQIELFRQKLVKADTTPVSLATVAGQVVEDDLVAYRRLPQFSVSSTVSADLAPARADADLLRRAIANIIAMAAQRSGQGNVTISAKQDTEQWLVLAITGSAFSGPAQPSDAMLDECGSSWRGSPRSTPPTPPAASWWAWRSPASSWSSTAARSPSRPANPVSSSACRRRFRRASCRTAR